MAEDDFWTEYYELLETFPHGNKVVEFHKKWHDHMGPNDIEKLLMIALFAESTKDKDER